MGRLAPLRYPPRPERRGFPRNRMKTRDVILAVMLAAAPLAAIAGTPPIHFIRNTKNWTILQAGAVLPAVMMETLPSHRPGAAHAHEYPILLRTLKPLPGCRIQGVAHWFTAPARWVASTYGIDCGKVSQKMRGYIIGNTGIEGLTPKRGTKVTVVFTQTVKIPR